MVTNLRATIGAETLMMDGVQAVELRKRGGWSNWYIAVIVTAIWAGGSASSGAPAAVFWANAFFFVATLIAAQREVGALALMVSTNGAGKPKALLAGRERALLEKTKQALLDGMIASRATR